MMKIESMLCLAVLAALAAGSLCAQDAPPAAKMANGAMMLELFADSPLVDRMAAMLRDADPLVREKVTRDLGQSNNPKALAPVEAMQADAEACVRLAAVRAAMELDANAGRGMAIKALADGDRAVVLGALAALRPAGGNEAMRAVAALLDHKDVAVVCAALDALTQWGQSAPAGRLAELLGEGPLARLRAAQNAALLSGGGDVTAALAKIAAGDTSAIRAEAIAALARLSPNTASPLASEAAASGDPQLRRGAAAAFGRLGKVAPIAALLDDASPMVQLAAVRAARDANAAACVPKLLDLMIHAIDDPLHYEAREALAGLGADAAAEDVAAALPACTGDLLENRLPTSLPVQAQGLKMTRLLERNVRSLSWLLGRFKTHAGYDAQLALLRKLPPDSRVLLDVLPALTAIDDERALTPMREMLSATVTNGEKAIRARLSRQIVKDYSEEVAAVLIDSLAAMKASAAVDDMVRIVQVNVSGFRLEAPSAAAARAMGTISTPQQRGAVEGAIRGILADAAYLRAAQFEAALAAGRLKLTAAAGELKALQAGRDSWAILHAAAWALGQIGQPVQPIGEPGLNQKGADWTVMAAEK